MRRRRCNGGILGCVAIALGVVILAALVLPPGFWWFLLSICLIIGGIWLSRWC